MEVILTTFQAQRIISSVKDESIRTRVSAATVVGDWIRIAFNRDEAMLLMHSIGFTYLDGTLFNKIRQAIDYGTTVRVKDKVIIIGDRGLMPKQSVGTVKAIVEVGENHRIFLVKFANTKYWRYYLAHEIEPVKQVSSVQEHS